jgi:hypothetical protein
MAIWSGGIASIWIYKCREIEQLPIVFENVVCCLMSVYTIIMVYCLHQSQHRGHCELIAIIKTLRPAQQKFFRGFFDGFILEWWTGACSTGLSILWKQHSRTEEVMPCRVMQHTHIVLILIWLCGITWHKITVPVNRLLEISITLCTYIPSRIRELQIWHFLLPSCLLDALTNRGLETARNGVLFYAGSNK